MNFSPVIVAIALFLCISHSTASPAPIKNLASVENSMDGRIRLARSFPGIKYCTNDHKYKVPKKCWPHEWIYWCRYSTYKQKCKLSGTSLKCDNTKGTLECCDAYCPQNSSFRNLFCFLGFEIAVDTFLHVLCNGSVKY